MKGKVIKMNKEDLTFAEWFKKIMKYVLNSLSLINLLLLGLAPIWGWEIEKITATIIVVAGVISGGLLGGKAADSVTHKENDDF